MEVRRFLRILKVVMEDGEQRRDALLSLLKPILLVKNFHVSFTYVLFSSLCWFIDLCLAVDGLLHCNEFSGRGDEKLNGTKPVSANFPFVEGQAFTATLWAGLHGFHMTVNGRHETSFLYRKVGVWEMY